MKTNPIFHTARRTTMYRLAAMLVFFLVLGPARESVASVLAYEGFNYFVNQPLPTMTGGIGWAPGPWTQLSGGMVDQPPSLTYPTALPSTGDALLTPAGGAASRNFAAPLSNSGSDLWVSFLEQNAVGAVPGAQVDIQQPIAVLPDIEVGKTAGNAITLNGLPAGAGAGVGADLFILQLVQWSGGGTLVNLFVDPGLVLGPPNASVLLPGPAFQAQDFYYQSNAGQELDEIRVGTTLSDVAAVAVPEPATFTLLVGALLPFAVKTRRLLRQRRVA